MGQVTTTAILDASDALIHSIQGKTVTFLPTGATLAFVKGFEGYELTLPCYKSNRGCVSFIFYLDVDGNYHSCEVWEGQAKQVLNDEQESVIEEVYEHLVQEELIKK